MSSRLAIVGVMGSGTATHARRSTQLGQWLAGRGVHLLTGGGGGVMAAVSKAFYEVSERRGLVIGILPSAESSIRPKAGYPNRWVEIPIFTHLPLSGTQGTELASRNHMNVLSSDVIVALPGSAGTASEVSLAVRYGRAVAAFLDSRDQLPGLPSDVPVYSDFAEVQRFVEARLSLTKQPGGPAEPAAAC